MSAHRALIAAGTVAHADSASRSVARDLDLAALAARLRDASSTAVNVRQAAAELGELLSASPL